MSPAAVWVASCQFESSWHIVVVSLHLLVFASYALQVLIDPHWIILARCRGKEELTVNNFFVDPVFWVKLSARKHCISVSELTALPFQGSNINVQLISFGTFSVYKVKIM